LGEEDVGNGATPFGFHILAQVKKSSTLALEPLEHIARDLIPTHSYVQGSRILSEGALLYGCDDFRVFS
jgi:hypothetical protein